MHDTIEREQQKIDDLIDLLADEIFLLSTISPQMDIEKDFDQLWKEAVNQISNPYPIKWPLPSASIARMVKRAISVRR
jgi:hypothetical protein